MRFTIPNLLTFFRLTAAPCVAIFLLLNLNATITLSIFLLAAVTDYVDGYLARVLNQASSLGKVLDPIADKAMVIITLCFLHFSLDDDITKFLFGIPVIVIIFREIFVSGIREYVGTKSDLLVVTRLSKWKTALQMIAIGVLLASNVGYFEFLPLTHIGLFILWFAALVTVTTGIDYFKKFLIDLKG